jgi:hypothetical protein
MWLTSLALLMLAGGERVDRVIEIAPVWAGHPVGFDLQTLGDRQFVAFYDDQRRLTVGARRLAEDHFQLVRLAETLAWDSHNYVTLTADDEGLLHLAGNMHAVPLVYFRSRAPWDITTFERQPAMVGTEESHCTYPKFFRGPAGELIFTYRDGRSGDGNQVFNVWDGAAHTWRRLLDKPLTDGEGRRNAYFQGPLAGPDGWWHLCWVWRESPDCATNHDLTYARSRDLRHWETSAGRPLALPITLKSGEIVDPVPVGGGIINGNTVIGFDAAGRVVLTYHKYDANGFTQLYSARLEDGQWQVHLVTDWQYRWQFSGGGSIPFEIGIGPLTAGPDGALTQSWGHKVYGSGRWRIDPETLRPLERLPRQTSALDAYGKVEGSFAGLAVHWLRHEGAGGQSFALRWETLGANRDRPRQPPLPPASMLRLYEVRTEG